MQRQPRWLRWKGWWCLKNILQVIEMDAPRFCSIIMRKAGWCQILKKPIHYQYFETMKNVNDKQEKKKTQAFNVGISRKQSIWLQASSAADDAFDLKSVKRNHIIKVLHHTHGNKTETARLLKIGLTTLYFKIEEYGITVIWCPVILFWAKRMTFKGITVR